MKTKLLVVFLLAGCSLSARGRFSIGIGIGSYPYPAPYYSGYYAPAPVYYAPPAPVVLWRPPYPGPGYSWVSGYWYPAGGARVWRAGYWARRPYPRAYRVAPRYYGPRYTRGYRRR